MNHQGTRWRGQLPIPEHSHPLVRELIREANAQRTTLREVAQRAGLSPKTISDWRYRGSPSISNLLAAFNALGKTLVVRDEKVARTDVPLAVEPPIAVDHVVRSHVIEPGENPWAVQA